MRNTTIRTSTIIAAVILVFSLPLARPLAAQSLAPALEPAAYNPVEYHQILLGTAKTMTASFQSVNTTPSITTSEIISAELVKKLLATPQAIYLREYFSLDEQGVMHILLVPRTADNHDILTDRITVANGTTIPQAKARTWIKNYVQSRMFKQHSSVYGSSIHKDAVQAVIQKIRLRSCGSIPHWTVRRVLASLLPACLRRI